MRISIIIDVEVPDGKSAMSIAKDIAQHPDVVKANVYDPGQSDFIPRKDIKYSRGFIRHIGAIGGEIYGG